MAKEIESLETRIRAKARTELHQQIDEAAKPLIALMNGWQYGWQYALETPNLFRAKANGSEGLEPSTVFHAIGEIKTRLFHEMIGDQEEKAIQDFLSRVNDNVDHLQHQINELKS